MRGTGGLKMELSAEQLSLIANSYAMEKRAVMEKYDMTSIEVDVMLFLANNPRFDTAAEIVSIRKIAKSHVSLAVSRLTERGYLEKSKDSKDRKKSHLVITEKASSMVKDAQKFQAEFREQMLAGFSKEERALLQDFTRRISRNLLDLSLRRNGKRQEIFTG